MKVTIQKLGMIRKAEIDLKPFTIFIGPNNAGKTWLAYALAGIFGSRGRDEYTQAYATDKLPKHYPPLDTAIEKVVAEGNAVLDLYKFAEDYGEAYFQQVADFARHWMDEFLSTQLAHFEQLQVSIQLAEAKAGFLERVDQSSLQSSIAGGLLSIRKKQGDRSLYAYTSTEGEEHITERLPAEAIKERFIQSVARVLHQALYPQIRVFPTERTTLVTFPFGSRTRERTLLAVDDKTREALESIGKALQQLQELSGLGISAMIDQNARTAIEPVSYFLHMISSTFRIGSRQIEKRRENAKNNVHIQQYMQLAEVLERQILSGGLDFSTSEPDPRRDILFQPAQDVTVEIPIASSMVKELSPLVLYLRYLAESGELLIIDEPEMNLHPEAQAKIIEFLAMLVNAGLRVLITTHSPYMLDHLTNLIRAAEYEKEDQVSLASQFFLERSAAFISEDDVAVYLVDHGETENVLHDGKINWGTFGDVSDRVAQIHYDL